MPFKHATTRATARAVAAWADVAARLDDLHEHLGREEDHGSSKFNKRADALMERVITAHGKAVKHARRAANVDTGFADRHLLGTFISRLHSQLIRPERHPEAMATAQHAKQLCTSISELTREGAQVHAHSPDATLRKVHGYYSAALPHKVKLELTYPSSAVHDPNLLYWAVTEAVGNSVKAVKSRYETHDEIAKRGRIKIASYPEGEHHVVEIKDNGIGMTADTLRKIRLGIEHSEFAGTHHGGSGKIFPQIIAAMARQGGTVEINSRRRRGTTVRLIFKQREEPA